MHPDESTLSKSMATRLWLVLAVVLVQMCVATAWTAARVVDDELTRAARARVSELSSAVTANLNARLMAAEAIVQNSVAADTASGTLRQRALRSPAIREVVTYPIGVPPPGAQLPVPLTAADRSALRSGQMLLRAADSDARGRSLYLVRPIAGGNAVYFELSPEWFWQGIAPVSADASVAVLDSAGAVLQATSEVSDRLQALLLREHQLAQLVAAPPVRGWQIDGVEWLGAASRLMGDNARLGSINWLVVSYAHAPTDSGLTAMLTALPALLLLATLLLLAATAYLMRGWLPPLNSMLNALGELGDGRYQRVALNEARDAPRELAVAFNRAVGQLQARMQALASLNEIDRLLLESSDLEQALDPILARICKITGCHGAALALMDPDAPDHARAYVAAASGVELPVNRISVDAELLKDLQEQRQGLTVTRCEPYRHSFLDPLQTLGAEFFWVWPVLSQDRVAAILAVGYLGVPSVPPELASYGTECAARLGAALSKSQRDEALYRQAHFDALTSLPNRLLFRDRLSQELASAAAGSQRGALLYVDLDHFKKVNDSVGHAAGDQLLQIAAQRLRACVKDGDTVARLGGDEFTVVLRGISGADSVRQVAARITESLQHPVNVGGRDHYVRASIGATLFPDDGGTIEDLMRNADLAMYRAKEGGRGRAVFYERSMEKSGTPVAESGLFRALRRREFSLYYQPQYSLSDGSLVGLEALLRWQPPREELRSPAQFIPAAEQSGLIVDIGAWVLETACNQLAIWREQGIAPQRLALNVSVHQLRQAEFSKIVRRALDRVNVPPEMLEIELTESVFADEEARLSLRRLAALGVRLSLDDFGTGYSSLGYLRQHPVQVIKIDRSFIEDVAQNVTAATLAETIIVMAHALGKQVVAEGVETAEQMEFLREHRCDMAQGFYLAHPRNVTETTELLLARRPLASQALLATG